MLDTLLLIQGHGGQFYPEVFCNQFVYFHEAKLIHESFTITNTTTLLIYCCSQEKEDRKSRDLLF